MKNVRDYAIQCIKDEANATLALIGQLDENFDKAVDLMYHCKGKVIVTGVGKSGNIGAKIAATLSSTGTPAFFANPLDVFHGKGRCGLGTVQFRTDGRASTFYSNGSAHEYSYHRHERKSKFTVG